MAQLTKLPMFPPKRSKKRDYLKKVGLIKDPYQRPTHKGYIGYVNGRLKEFPDEAAAQAAGATQIQPNYLYYPSGGAGAPVRPGFPLLPTQTPPQTILEKYREQNPRFPNPGLPNPGLPRSPKEDMAKKYPGFPLLPTQTPPSIPGFPRPVPRPVPPGFPNPGLPKPGLPIGPGLPPGFPRPVPPRFPGPVPQPPRGGPYVPPRDITPYLPIKKQPLTPEEETMLKKKRESLGGALGPVRPWNGATGGIDPVTGKWNGPAIS